MDAQKQHLQVACFVKLLETDQLGFLGIFRLLHTRGELQGLVTARKGEVIKAGIQGTLLLKWGESSPLASQTLTAHNGS